MLAPTLLLAAVLPAQAGGSAEALTEALKAETSPAEIAVACAPAGAALQGIVGFMGLMGRSEASRLPPPLAGVLTLADPSAARAAGLNPDGVLLAGMGPDKTGGWASVSFDGTPAQAEALLGVLNQNPKPANGGWILGSGEEVASLQGGTLRLQRGAPSEGGVAPDFGLLAGLPTTPSCTLWGNLPEDRLPEKMRESGSTQMVIQIPMVKGGDLLLRTRMGEAAPAYFARPSGAPAGGSSTEAPSVVLAFGASPFDVLADPMVAEKAKINPDEIARAQHALNLAPGTTLVIFGDPSPKNIDYVLVLPVRSPPGAMNRPRALNRRVVKLLGKLDLQAEKNSATTFTAVVNGKTVYGGTRAGRVVLAARPDRVTEVVNNVGRSWLEGADLDRLQNWTLAAWTGPGLTADEKMGNVAIDLGLRSFDGAWELGIRVRGEPAGGWPALFGAFAGGMNRTFGTVEDD